VNLPLRRRVPCPLGHTTGFFQKPRSLVGRSSTCCFYTELHAAGGQYLWARGNTKTHFGDVQQCVQHARHGLEAIAPPGIAALRRTHSGGTPGTFRSLTREAGQLRSSFASLLVRVTSVPLLNPAPSQR
jgi:hypothetical protein